MQWLRFGASEGDVFFSSTIQTMMDSRPGQMPKFYFRAVAPSREVRQAWESSKRTSSKAAHRLLE